MNRTIYVDCPCCGARLEAEAESGKVVRHWKTPKKKESLEDTLRRLEKEKDEHAGFFEKAAGQMEAKKRKAREAFEQGVEKIKKEGLGERPIRDIDLD